MKRNEGACEKTLRPPLAASRAFASKLCRSRFPVTRETCRAKAAGQSCAESECVLLHIVDILAASFLLEKLMIFRRI